MGEEEANMDLPSNVGLPADIEAMGSNDPVRLAYFSEKKKEVYLNTLLRSLNDCFRKLKAQHGVAQTKKSTKELKD